MRKLLNRTPVVACESLQHGQLRQLTGIGPSVKLGSFLLLHILPWYIGNTLVTSPLLLKLEESRTSPHKQSSETRS
jgi:hypothetical protein